ncbi:GntR family transcriptional regulator [Saccharibacillus sacchari]|uniref:GntR family transcriptional regulator n=1 Tax=Saccharibacillus sacchari TaxID=456493 RepID=UPI0004AF65C4|nr:GntR family transcriptional regulator [Saccharibacillus sacchari]
MKNDSASKPMYEQIFEALRERIRLQQYKIGDRVPSEKELCDEFGVSRITTKKALEMLVAQQLVVRQPGRGSFVADPALFADPTLAQESAEAALSGISDKKSGRSSATNRKRMIGLVITHFSDMYGTELVYGMEEASREHDGFLVLRRSFGVPEQEQRNIVELLELGVDGLIIFPAQGEYFSEEILKLVIGKFPFVMIDRFLKGIPASSVSTDNAGAAKAGTRHLFELGHRNIAFLTQPPINTTAIEERIKGIVDAHAEQGVLVNRELWVESLVSTLPNSFDPQDQVTDVDTLVRHLEAHPEITALFAAEYPIALLAEQAAAKLGRRIPEDLSLICFDSPENPNDIRVTHLRQNQFEMGKKAFEMVIELMKSTEHVVQRIELPAELVRGKTVAEAKTPSGRQ